MSTPARRSLSTTEWLICAVSAIGFAFDIYVLLMLPLIVGPALQEMANLKQGTPEYQRWVGLLFYVPAIAGGAFGLVGGYLTDLFGRRRILVFSILLYAFATLAAGFSATPEQLLFFRTLVFIGVCVEFVAAVAWLAELFPDPHQREQVLGWTQAFSSIGGLMVTVAYGLAVTYADSLPEIMGGHQAWRWTVMSGVLPAIPLMIIRPFLPESPAWAAKKAAGTLKRPSFGELFAPEYRRATIVSAIMFALSYGAAFGALQHLPRIVPGLPELASLAPAAKQKVVAGVQLWQELGGLLGRVVLAFFAVRLVSRQGLMRMFQIPALFIIPLVFFYPAKDNLDLLKIGVGLAGLLVVAQFSFWGNYLPLVYPLHLRGTGESFAANVGGRMVGTSFAYLTTQLTTSMPGANPFVQLANAAGAVALFVCAAGLIASFFLPEPDAKKMSE